LQQLNGLDATFLNLETGRSPLHISGLAIYDQSTAPGRRVRFKAILENVEARLHLARCFRQKLARVPLGLDHPYWIEDREFDLEFHVRHIALPRPGDWRQLCIQAARIHARPLDLAKPLWEMYVIEGLGRVEGLPKGSFAILTKIHHAAVDGVSGAEIAAAVHDLEPDAKPVPPAEAWLPERDPSGLELALRTAVNNVRQPFQFARVLASAAPPALRTILDRSNQPTSESDTEVPRTRFNERVTPHRAVEGRNFSLATIKRIRKVIPGATVNDVVLATCSGGLRRYLEHHGELPNEPLVAFTPVSVRSEDQAGTAGNQVSGMLVNLHSDESDSLDRLESIHDTTTSAKELNNAIGARTMTDITQFMPGALAGLAGRVVARSGLMRRLRPIANCVITNVPGPQIPLYMTRARMVANYGLGLPLDGMGLFHAIFSYNGTLTITVTCCREMLPDPEFYIECIQSAFDELESAASEELADANDADPLSPSGA
jgi:WS/DGAT/MGAT family acyltransferase